MRKLSALAVLSIALFSACAPTTTGTSSFSPQAMETGLSPVRIQPGQTLYVQFTYSRQSFKVNDKYFDDLKIDFSNRSGTNVNSAEAFANWLTLKQVSDLPEGVTASLDRAFIVKEIASTTNNAASTNVTYYEKVRVILKVAASSQAKAGTVKFGKLTFTDGSQENEVPLVVSVVEKI